jgi:hypothetical protein
MRSSDGVLPLEIMLSHRSERQAPARRHRPAEENAETVFLWSASMAFPRIVEQAGQTSLVDECLKLTAEPASDGSNHPRGNCSRRR